MNLIDKHLHPGHDSIGQENFLPHYATQLLKEQLYFIKVKIISSVGLIKKQISFEEVNTLFRRKNKSCSPEIIRETIEEKFFKGSSEKENYYYLKIIPSF